MITRCALLVGLCIWASVGLAEPVTAPDNETPSSLPDLTLDQADGQPLSLERCVELAVRVATSVLKAQNNTELTGAALLQSYGQFLPNLTTQANSTYSTGSQYFTTGVPTTVVGSNMGAGYTIGTDLNIFNGLSDYAHLKASLLRKSVADLSLHRAKEAIALDVTQNYLSAVLDNHLVEIAEKNLQQSRARERLLVEQTRVGSKNLADLFRQQAQTSADESLLLTAENKKRADQIRLLQKMRMDVTAHYRLVDPADPVEEADQRFEDEGKLLKTGLIHRSDLQAIDHAADAAHYDVKSQWGNYLPKLDLQANMVSGGHYLYNQTVAGQDVVPASQTGLYSQLGSQIDYSVGLVLTWTIFDRFSNQQDVAKARVQASNAQIDAQDIRNQVQADVRLAYNNYKTATQRLRSSRKGLEAARKAYEVIEGRYEVGSATFIDLITAQSTLLQAESTRAQALSDFTLQAKVLEFATGETQVEN